MMRKKKGTCAKCGEDKLIYARKLCSYCYNMESKENKKTTPVKRVARSYPKRKPRKRPSSNKAKKRGIKSESIRLLKAKLWRIFSRFVRLRDSDEFGFCTCITSGERMYWKKAQAGHFISRRFSNTLFHEQNVHAQSAHDNCYLSGNQYIYGKRLDEIYGEGTADKILALSKEEKRFTVEELKLMIIDYSQRVEKLLKDKGISE